MNFEVQVENRPMPQPARVLHVITDLQVGGAETFVMNVFRRIDRTKVVFDAVVCTEKAGFYEEEFRSLGGRIFRLPYPNLRNLGLWCHHLYKIIRDEGPFTAIHGNVHFFNAVPALVGHISGVPTRIAHSHTVKDGKPGSLWRRCYREAMRKMIRAEATHLLGCSAPACRELFGAGYARGEVFHCAIDPDKFPSDEDSRDTVRSTLGVSERDFALIHVARFAPAKNHSRLIEIFAELTKVMPEAHLVLVGKGVRAGLEHRCRELGLERKVTFLGLRDDVPRLLTACDAFLFPSLYEGLALVVLEAQMAGLPCIISDAIPHEADLKLGLVRRLSLSDSNEIWVKEILAAKRQQRPARRDREEHLRTAGFDMREAAPRWESLYLRRQDFKM